jgi:hypothetical protein
MRSSTGSTNPVRPGNGRFAAGRHFQENLNQIVEGDKSIWVGTSAGRVLRFDPADFR